MKNALLSILLIFCISMVSCRDEKLTPQPHVYTNGEGIIGEKGGTIIVGDENSPIKGAFIEIPEGAMPSDTKIKISKAPEDVNNPADSLAILIRFEPQGLTFEKPVKIGVPVYNINDTLGLNIFYFEADSVVYTQMPKLYIDVDKKIIVGETMHFSYYTAIDRSAKIQIEMLNIANKIGVRLKLNNLDKISTTFEKCLHSSYCNVWDVIKNFSLENKSVFRVGLYRHRSLWVDEYTENRMNVYVWRQVQGMRANAVIYMGYDGPTHDYLAYTSPYLTYNNPDSELAMWNTGEPLIFYFDEFEPDQSHNYFVKIKWFYSELAVQNFLGRATPLYEFDNKEARMKVSQMTLFPKNQLHSSKLIDNSYIRTPPEALFVGTPTSGTAPLTVSFTDQSTNNPTSWSWNFGDGTTSTQRNPSKTYNNPGVYNVSLTATNSHGSNSHTKNSYITVNAPGSAPVAAFSGTPTSGTAPLTVSFTDQSTNNPTSWSWNFGDGTTSTQRNPSKTYNNPGVYNVSLTATNSHGSNTQTKNSYITANTPGSAPVAAFSGTPTSGTTPLTVSFTDQSTNNPTSWSWNFGDGTTSSQRNPSKTFNNPGVYDISVTATNSHGSNSHTKNSYITANAPGNAPVAAFSGIPTSGTAPLTVSFTDQSTNNPTSWSWNFGDGTTSSQQNPSHTYVNPGNYTVQLTIANAHGSDAETKTAYIQVSGGQAGETGTFTDSRDGQTYKWVKIGNQVWMAENLNFASANSWCYENIATNCDHYGRLYTWDAVMNGASSSSDTPSGVQGVCPTGWHVPSHDEWTQLEQYICNQLGNSDCATKFPYDHSTLGWRGTNEGNAMKSCRQVGSPLGGACNTSDHPRWDSHSTHYGTDEFGFSALPGGGRWYDGSFYGLGGYGRWWSATELSSASAWYRGVYYGYGTVYRDPNDKANGFSLRCVRN